jgi:hypothetical protein
MITNETQYNDAKEQLRARRRAAGLTTQGLPRGYRNNPLLLQTLPAEPRRGFSLRKPENWIEKECLYCGALMLSTKNHRIFCSRNCYHSYKFRQKHTLLAI